MRSSDPVSSALAPFEQPTSRPEQLDLFKESPQRGEASGEGSTVELSPFGSGGIAPAPRAYQLTELPGTTFEDIFKDAA